MALPTCLARLFLCCSLWWVSIADDDCPYKECGCSELYVNCAVRRLTSIPELSGPRYGREHLDMQKNYITVIPAGRLPSNLTDINFSNNPITTIDVAAFDDSRDTLRSLTFSEANFTRIPDAILHLRVLGSFNIYNTRIEDWNSDVMKSIGSTVDTLYLLNVGMKVWPNWMQDFPHLKDLRLESNFLSSLPDNALEIQANSLTILTLNKNNLTAVPKTLSNQTALMSLDLGNNRITDITWLPQSTQLSYLYLMDNRISDGKHLSNLLRPVSSILMNLELFGNQLTEIPDLSFLKQVDSLDLSHNKMSSPYSGNISTEVTSLILDFNSFLTIPRILFDVPQAYTLALSNNLVTAIHDYEIPIWIEEIDLGYNMVRELTDTSFPRDSQLITLDLKYNPIVQISDQAFINLKLLTNLSLKNSRLTRLPLALGSLDILNWLEITGSPNLVCTCLEKSLGPWVLTRQPNIVGTCGQTTIYEFFLTLSPDCPN